MQMNEIQDKKWKIDNELKVYGIRVDAISKLEQELHINLLAKGYESEKEEIHICCSIPKWINKLADNPSFNLKKVMKSKDVSENNDKVLQIDGIIYDSSLFSLRTKKKTINLSPEQVTKRKERMAEMRNKRLNKN